MRRDDDNAARRALSRKTEHAKLAAALGDQHAAAESASHKLRTQIDAIRVRLSEARRQQATLIARKRAADARRSLARDMNGITIDDSAFSKFDRVAMKVEQAEAEADALLELTACCDPADEIDPAREDVETELTAMKHSMATAECSS